jgi:hypothetical protein
MYILMLKSILDLVLGIDCQYQVYLYMRENKKLICVVFRYTLRSLSNVGLKPPEYGDEGR